MSITIEDFIKAIQAHTLALEAHTAALSGQTAKDFAANAAGDAAEAEPKAKKRGRPAAKKAEPKKMSKAAETKLRKSITEMLATAIEGLDDKETVAEFRAGAKEIIHAHDSEAGLSDVPAERLKDLKAALEKFIDDFSNSTKEEAEDDSASEEEEEAW